MTDTDSTVEAAVGRPFAVVSMRDVLRVLHGHMATVV
jgi:hypothetical protein